MDIKHLQYFLEVSKTENFTQAAENLYITQPALSRIVKTLEGDLGVALFHRSRKKITLTDAGKVLHKHASKIAAQITELEQEIDQIRTLKTGHIRIGLPTVVNSFFFSQLIADFHLQYPGVTFHLEENGSKVIEEKVLDGELDCGVVVLNNHLSADYYTFVEDNLNLVVSNQHSLANENKKQIQIQDLKDESFIMFNQDFESRNIIIQACKQSGFEPKIVSETSQIDFLEEMVATNLGVTLLPDSTSQSFTKHIKRIPIINPTISWNLAFIWKKDTYLSQINKQFITFTKEKLIKHKET
ncbi:DNA-binding transcriptional regulator, LysR family [Gracilibacillus orientalis]|uniref:DNA-binding transcriptional regulator, LysR family n=1 Tax=Gracilibacillus orientalis TaxID=334253 RepID=A0A1I4IGD8_9BACI|nr:LysR family transcriptional regulator [Gracilibacillus orientalis]SFL53378.1 DNA-binding transcriptional regulator, LysR family [Gracilibacillus orientalis]